VILRWTVLCLAVALLDAAVTTTAWADGPCETGCMGSPNPDSCRASCRHYDSLRGGGTRGPSFAAIAVTRDGKHYGYSFKWESRAVAQQKALSFCRDDSGGTQDCVIGVWFHDSCGALVRGDNGIWGADWGRTTREASAKATTHCEAHGGKNCTPTHAFCTN
jgi:hypothetical protein